MNVEPRIVSSRSSSVGIGGFLVCARRRRHSQSKILNTSRGRRDAYLDHHKSNKINGHKFWIRSADKVINFTLTTPAGD